MKYAITFSLTLFYFFSSAQVFLNQIGKVKNPINDYGSPARVAEEGEEIILIRIENDKVLASKKDETKKFTFKVDFLDRLEFSYNTVEEFWKVKGLQSETYKSIAAEGIQYDLRKELEEDALDFHNYVKNNGLLFNDEYLESHLYALVLETIPHNRGDGRPGIISISILADPVPNAFIFANGSMYITTGLLSTINSDAELQAVLTHEVAHFMLDHQILNINLEKKRQKRAEFWAAFATGLAAAADVYLATNNDYYAPGILTAGTAILSFSVASAITDQMGLSYNRTQEFEADNATRDLLTFLGKEPEALATALNKIKYYAIKNGDYSIISNKGTHPNIDLRINNIGKPANIIDSKYDVRLSMINSFNAIMEFKARRFESCAALIQRNISAGVPTEDDYLLLAMTNMYRFNTKEKNEEALTFIKSAKSLNILPNIMLHKQEALALIRLNKLAEAKVSLQTYLSSIDKESERMKNILDPKEWSRIHRFLLNEYSWTKQMLSKVDKL